jgi:Fe-S-cluster containining protein
MECLKCGKCCSHLRIGDEESGLTIFPDEIHLFPENTIKPHYGKGVTEPSIIFTYQHTENVCFHLKAKICTIYETRPLMCQSFPVKIRPNGLSFSPGCKAVLRITRTGINYLENSELIAAIKMTERLVDFHTSFVEDEQIWKYNLVLEQWEIV